MPSISFANPANNVASSLSTSVSASAGSIPLIPNGGAIFPAAPFYVSCEFEVMYCIGKSGDTLTVSRGVDGTIASVHPASAIVEIRNNAGLWKDAYNAINSNSAVVDALTSNVYSGAALPPDVVYQGKTQELTHKTIDLTDVSKGNQIIGSVTPDLSQFPYNNVLANGGFDQWSGLVSINIPAGAAGSGLKTAPLAPFWNVTAINDSTITASQDQANPDSPASGYDLLVNMSTVQANDYVEVAQPFDAQRTLNFDGAVNQQFSAGARIKSISGAIQVAFRFQYTDSAGAVQSNLGPFTPVSSVTYLNYKREGVVWFPALGSRAAQFSLCFKGVGQISIDNVMVVISSLAANYRPIFPLPPAYSPNLLQNGGFETWRGPGPFTVDPSVFADPWAISSLGTGTISITRDSANADSGSQYCAAVVYAKGSIVTDITQIGFMPASQLRGQMLTVSARIKTSVANAVRLRINDGVTGAQNSAYHSGNGLYQTITLTYPVAAAPLSINLAIELNLSCTAYLDNVTAVVGSQPASYIPALSFPDALPNARLGPDVARANLLVNGGFEVWQRGGGPFSAGVVGADRWTVYAPGGTTIVNRDSPNIDVGGFCASIATTAPAGVGNGLYQVIDCNSENQQFRGRTLSVSVRVKCSQANSVRLGLAADKGTVPTVFSSYHSGGGTYETLTATIALGVVNGMTVWITGLVAGTWYADNAMMVLGAIPADFVAVPSADELARCLRYYELVAWGTPGTRGEYGGAGGTPYFHIPYRAIKPIIPTVTKVGTFSVSNCSQPITTYIDTMAVGLSTTITALGSYFYQPNGAAQGWIAEGNP